MAKDKLDKALANVDEGRRGLLRGMLIGGAALAALPLITSTAVGQDQGGSGSEPPKKKKKKADSGTSANPLR